MEIGRAPCSKLEKSFEEFAGIWGMGRLNAVSGVVFAIMRFSSLSLLCSAEVKFEG
jgi:hypothetical protein